MRSKPPVPADSAGLAAVQSDPPGINCRIRLASDGKEGSACETFTVEICGEIHAPDDEKQMALNVIAFDVTDPESAPRPVYARGEQHSSGDSPVFCYDTDLGKLPGRDAVLSDWITVAQLEVDWLMFPRQGARNLRFRTSIVSRSSNRELACAECAVDYDNNDLGYIDLDENDARTRTLAVALAFAVSAADNKMYKCELDLIKNWARNNVSIERASTKARRKLEKAFDTTIAFFRGGNHLNTFEICREIVEIAPIADRYNILDLCLHVARAKGSVAPEELAILGDLAGSLEVDADVFRQMSEKVLPVNIHQSKDADMVLGVTPDMNSEKARQHLNEEYTKWNARVTNADPQIQAQADQMLALIAEARSQYVG